MNSIATFKVGSREFVVVPKRRYEQLTKAERDRKDAAIAARGNAEYLSGKTRPVALAVARKDWGV